MHVRVHVYIYIYIYIYTLTYITYGLYVYEYILHKSVSHNNSCLLTFRR